MPTYEYACTACGHRLEAVQKFTDEPLTECPECHGALRKVYGAVGIVLKGSGFYKNDSRDAARAGNGKSTTANGSDKGTEKESSTSKTESAPKTDGDKGSGDGGKDKKDAKPAAATAS